MSEEKIIDVIVEALKQQHLNGYRNCESRDPLPEVIDFRETARSLYVKIKREEQNDRMPVRRIHPYGHD